MPPRDRCSLLSRLEEGNLNDVATREHDFATHLDLLSAMRRQKRWLEVAALQARFIRLTGDTTVMPELGLCFYRLHMWHGAVGVANDLLVERGPDRFAHILRAACIARLGDLTEAERSIGLIDDSRLSAPEKALLADYLATKGDLPEAEALIDEALAEGPDNADCIWAGVYVAEQSESWARAEALLERAKLSGTAAETEIDVTRAHLARVRGDKDGALQILAEVLRVEPQHQYAQSEVMKSSERATLSTVPSIVPHAAILLAALLGLIYVGPEAIPLVAIFSVTTGVGLFRLWRRRSRERRWSPEARQWTYHLHALNHVRSLNRKFFFLRKLNLFRVPKTRQPPDSPLSYPARCWCNTVASLHHDVAYDYSTLHLGTIRSVPDVGGALLRCPSTAQVWAMIDDHLVRIEGALAPTERRTGLYL